MVLNTFNEWMTLARTESAKNSPIIVSDILPISMISSNQHVFGNNPSYKYVDGDKLATHKKNLWWIIMNQGDVRKNYERIITSSTYVPVFYSRESKWRWSDGTVIRWIVREPAINLLNKVDV